MLLNAVEKIALEHKLVLPSMPGVLLRFGRSSTDRPTIPLCHIAACVCLVAMNCKLLFPEGHSGY